MNIISTLKPLGRWVETHSAQIFTGLAIVGVPTTVGLTIKATMETTNKCQKLEALEGGHVDTLDKTKASWKYWIPPFAAAVGTAGCIIAANHVHFKKEAALSALAAVYSGKYKDLEKTMREKIGDKKADEILEDIQKKDIPVSNAVIDQTFEIYEPYSKQFIRLTTEKLLHAQLIVNQMLKESGECTLNHFLFLIGGKRCAFGDQLGWDDTMLCEDCEMTGHSWIDIKPYLADIGGKKTMYITYSVSPEGL